MRRTTAASEAVFPVTRRTTGTVPQPVGALALPSEFGSSGLQRVCAVGDHRHGRDQFCGDDFVGRLLALQSFEHLLDAREAFLVVVAFHHRDASINR
jgi:hypothetical protein